MRLIVTRSFQKAFVGTVVILCVLSVSNAQVMQSSNYRMQSDSVNSGGGLSTSTNYGMEDTVGETATGIATSSNYQLKAGYQQMQEVYISLSAPANVVMSPSLGGLTGGVSQGTTSFSVVTDSAAGYTVTIQSATSAAMRSGNNVINDYVPGGAVPDFIFTTNSTQKHFAYSPQGADIAQRFQDSGGVCGVAGSDTSGRCWDGLRTTPVEIVRRTSSNHPLGATTTVLFSVGIGGNVGVPPGQYIATTTVTALAL